MDNDADVLAAFDAQMRRDTAGGVRDGGVVREAGARPGSWAAVVWSDLDEAGADRAVEEPLRWLASPEGRGREFEWKLYAHDRPADLGERLRRAGFVPGDPETLMVARTAALPTDAEPPAGVRLAPVTDPAGVDLLVRAHDSAFGTGSGSLRRRLLDQLAEDPDNLRMVVATAGGEPVSGARMELHPGTQFASLWGGGTAPQWRGRGIYRALVAHRARIAAELGVRWLQVDASAQSRPILARLGFAALSVTTPYVKQG
jgi:ribosomal protein S18 acetylase RimI-like enzyme